MNSHMNELERRLKLVGNELYYNSDRELKYGHPGRTSLAQDFSRVWESIRAEFQSIPERIDALTNRLKQITASTIGENPDLGALMREVEQLERETKAVEEDIFFPSYLHNALTHFQGTLVYQPGCCTPEIPRITDVLYAMRRSEVEECYRFSIYNSPIYISNCHHVVVILGMLNESLREASIRKTIARLIVWLSPQHVNLSADLAYCQALKEAAFLPAVAPQTV